MIKKIFFLLLLLIPVVLAEDLNYSNYDWDLTEMSITEKTTNFLKETTTIESPTGEGKSLEIKTYKLYLIITVVIILILTIILALILKKFGLALIISSLTTITAMGFYIISRVIG